MLNAVPVKLANRLTLHTRGMGKRSDEQGSTDLGLRIKARRIELGWTQDELAGKAGCTKGAVSQWETGDVKNLKLARLLRVADALDVEVRWLIAGEGDKKRRVKGEPFQYTIEENSAIRNLRAAEPAYRNYVIALALMTEEQQRLMLRTMREAVPDTVIEKAYGKPPPKRG